jgi:uncharacterized membrane protein YjfL (UPF0719 family)
MKQILKTLGLGITIGVVLSVVPITSSSVSAQISSGLNMASTDELKKQSVDSLAPSVVNILLWAVGLISVVMIIFGGFRYIISNGDSTKVTAAKNTVMYAVVGLVIAIFSFAIIQFAKDRTTSVIIDGNSSLSFVNTEISTSLISS